jgi:hypothetical protein
MVYPQASQAVTSSDAAVQIAAAAVVVEERVQICELGSWLGKPPQEAHDSQDQIVEMRLTIERADARWPIR